MDLGQKSKNSFASKLPGWAETPYDRIRGKVEMGNLMSLPAPIPGMVTVEPDPAYTPRQNPLNVLGTKLLRLTDKR